LRMLTTTMYVRIVSMVIGHRMKPEWLGS